MTYNKQTWTDGAAGNTPLSAARFNYMENGIAAASNIAPQNMVTLGCFTGYQANGYYTVNGAFTDPFVTLSNGMVFLEGLITTVGNPTIAAGGSLNLCKLPVGYRPAGQLVFLQPMGSGTNTYARVDVLPDGTISVSPLGSGLASGAYISLGGMLFRQVN